jgi:hypothetical protein
MKNRFQVMDSTEIVIAKADRLQDAIYFCHKKNNESEYEDNFLIYDDLEKKCIGIYW